MQRREKLYYLHLQADLKVIELTLKEFSLCCTVMNPKKSTVLAVLEARKKELEVLLDEYKGKHTVS